MSDLITLVEVTAYDPSRANLLPYPREFDNAAWTKNSASVTANAATAPDNLVLADKLVEAAASADHFIWRTAITTPTNVPYTFSVFAKAAGRDVFRLQLYGNSTANSIRGQYTFSTEAVSVANNGTASGATAGMQRLRGGWYRCWVTGIPEAVDGGSLAGARVQLINASTTYLGDGTSGIHMDRALLELGSTLGEWFDNGTAAGPGTKTLRYGTHRFITAAADIPPDVAFDPRIIEAPNFARTAFSNLRVTGGGSVGEGVLELANADQALSGLLDLGLDGRDIVVRIGSATAAYPSGFTTWLTGTIEQPEVGNTRAVLRLRDRLAVLQQPLQSAKYAGTNSLPAGAEGVADDIKGQPKPLLWGRAYQVPAVLVNTARLIYQIHDGQMQAVDAVYDQGVALIFSGTDRANLAAMEAAAPAAGQYDTCLALGLIRLGATPAGRVTVDARGDAASSYVDRVGAIVQRILTQRCGVAVAQIDTTSITDLDTAANFEVGIWIGAEAARQSAIDALLASVGAWLSPDRTGQWQVGQLVAPSGTADIALTDTEIIDIDRLATNDPDRGVPVWRVNLRYKRFWTQFGEADIAGAVTTARRAELRQEWRTVTATDTAVQATHLLAPTLDVDTLLTSATDAATERDRRLALHGVRRDFVRVRVPLTTETAALNLGSIVDVTTPALGYDAGRKFTVTGIAREAERIDLDLWG